MPDHSDYEAKRAELRRHALEYHEFPTPGKIAIAAQLGALGFVI